MRLFCGLLGIVACLPFTLSAGEKSPPKQDYEDFSRLIHRTAVKQLPKQFEDVSGWGQMIEIPGNLRLMGLRKVVKVGNHLEAPHGAWRKFKGRIEDPDKNLKIVVKDFKFLEEKKIYRIVVDVDVTMLCHTEWQQWQKGLLLIGAEAVADANITAALVCDVNVLLDITKFPPELKIEPKVTDLALDLADFKLRGEPIIKGETGDGLRNDLKEFLRSVVKSSGPFVKDQANQAIVQSLRDGKGAMSADGIMKALPKTKK